MPIPCKSPSARPDHFQRSNRHGAVPKTRPMNTGSRSPWRANSAGSPCPKTIQITRDMPQTPLRSSGAAQTLRLGTDIASNRSCELSAPCHPACLLFTITSEQDNGGHKHAPLQTLSLISECHQGKFINQPGDWWSQTGSNRRPQACKASALPTELWPRPSGHVVIAKTGWPEWTRTTDLTLIRRVL